MNKRKNRFFVKLITLTIAALTAILCCCACGINGIREDAVFENLPAIDPEAGLTRDISVKLYFRLIGEKYIVGVTRNVSVRPNERDEEAIVRTLLLGIPPLATGISEVFPEGTRLIDASLDGGVLHITLSEDFFTTQSETNAWNEGSQLREAGRITDEEFAQMIADAREEIYLRRRLTIYSLVNTITEYNSHLRVLVWIMSETKGTGLIPRSELGLEQIADATVDQLESMTYEGSVVATPSCILECTLNRVVKNEFETAYNFFADMDSTGQQKPNYADFETLMKSLGRVLSFDVYETEYDTANQGIAYVTVEMKVRRNDDDISVSGTVETKREGDIYLVGYLSFIDLLEGGRIP